MNHTGSRERITQLSVAAALLGLLLAAGGACRDGRNALPPAPPLGAGGAAAGIAAVAPGAPPSAGPSTPGVEGPSLGIVLSSKQSHYKLRGDEDRIPARLHDLRQRLDGAAKAPPKKGKAKQDKTANADQEPPAAPLVDMTLRIVNRSKQRVEFWSDGDGVTVTLRLEGVGAVTASMPVMHTMELRAPKVVTLGPGESYDLPITKLEFGERGDSVRAYWTRPGDYSIVPSLETAVRPAWPGTSVDSEGFGRVMLAGPPLRVHVDPK